MIFAYVMRYGGEKVHSDLQPVPFEDRYYDAYAAAYNQCFYEMRQTLNILPYNFYDSMDKLAPKKDQLFLLMQGDELIGSVACMGNEIDDLFVAQKFQGMGYGKQLLLFAIHHIQQANSDPITLHVAKWNEKAISLYQQNGFKCVYAEKIR